MDRMGAVDGDGVGDWIVGCIHANSNGGSISLRSGQTGAEILVVESPFTTTSWGSDIASTGDSDGDGVDNFVVGQWVGNGSARLFSGATGQKLHMWSTPAQVGDRFGDRVAGIGDVDGDGLGDVLVGAPFDNSTDTRSGKVRIYSGASGALIRTHVGTGFYDYYGYGACGAGDWNGDGYGDYLVAGKDSTKGGPVSRVDAYSGIDGSLLHSWNVYAFVTDANGPDMEFGPDLNGDGIGDLLLGLWTQYSGVSEGGRVAVFSGETEVGTVACGEHPRISGANNGNLSAFGVASATATGLQLASNAIPASTTVGYFLTSSGLGTVPHPRGAGALCIWDPTSLGLYASQPLTANFLLGCTSRSTLGRYRPPAESSPSSPVRPAIGSFGTGTTIPLALPTRSESRSSAARRRPPWGCPLARGQRQGGRLRIAPPNRG